MASVNVYDIVVVGAGPAGIMVAIRAAQLGKRVLLIEKNNFIGRKLMLTGKGRCNLTNTAPLNTFIEKFGQQGKFLRSAFSAFFNRSLISFFESTGLKLKIERQGRVFPVTDDARSVVDVLKRFLLVNKVDIRYNTRLLDIKKQHGLFKLDLTSHNKVDATKVILATGGISFKSTGSTGDGSRIAEKLGHTIVPLKPALVPLKTIESWVKAVQGVTLKKIRLVFIYGKKKIVSEIGELVFTHFGVSGPLILDLSGQIVSILSEYKKVRLLIDFKPGLQPEQLDNRLLRELKLKGNPRLKNVLKNLLPQRFIEIFMRQAGMEVEKKVNQITRPERCLLRELLKGFPLTIIGSLPIEEAMVTNGGVSTKEINPRTMESRIVAELYFAGEMIDGCASSGGYNLQQAFSTGYLAGESAARA